MNFIKTTSIVAVSVVATLAMASIFGFQLSEITAEETEDKEYKFGEGVSVTGNFKFREGTELYTFEVYEQKSGFARAEPFVFELQRIVGETPLLHKHADQSFLYRSSEVQKQDYNPFDVDIILASSGDAKRVFKYTDCYVDDYNVETLFDKEEGWMGKGFVVIDIFEIECRNYAPHNPTYLKMTEITPPDRTTKSSLEYKAEQRKLFP